MNFSKVRCVESVGVVNTYDITVDKNHNFLCNGHIIHNCGYTGEVKVILINHGEDNFKIEHGDRIAQGVVSPVISGRWSSLTKVDVIKDTHRKQGGFGSTGIK